MATVASAGAPVFLVHTFLLVGPFMGEGLPVRLADVTIILVVGRVSSTTASSPSFRLSPPTPHQNFFVHSFSNQ